MSNKKVLERIHPGVLNDNSIEHIHRYILAIEIAKDKDVLDIACGEGYGSNLLSKVARTVVGIDIDKKTINEAEYKYKTNNLSFVQCEATKLLFDNNTFDVIVCFETIEHIKEYEKLIAELKRVLKKDGLLILSTPNKRTFSDQRNHKNPFHIKEFYFDEFTYLLSSYFKNHEILTQEAHHTSFIHSKQRYDNPIILNGNFDTFEKYQSDGYYFIGICSDHIIPSITSSFLNGDSIFHSAIKQMENELRMSLTYQIGHFILYPFKLFKRFFQRK